MGSSSLLPGAAPDHQVLAADLVWTGERFEAGVRIEIGAEGLIRRVGRFQGETTRALTGQALLPGFVSAHSHAFQRGLRGRGETFPEGTGSFWTWRQAMYSLVDQLDRETFYRLCYRTFREMLSCGITCVGEFHYLHHPGAGQRFDGDELVLAAAAEAGIRIVLLHAFYKTGGIGQPLKGGQRRFATPSLEEYWEQIDHLAERLDSRRQSLGIVAHSIRAADPDEVLALYEEARRRRLVFHMHLEEQRQEIEACEAAYGKRPLALITERLGRTEGMTAVHCTHSRPEDLAPFLAGGGHICLCPLTEANLGDGIADLPSMLSHPGQICLGTDSNARLAMTEEMRWLEYGQRLARERRGVCRDEDGNLGRRLLAIATRNGGRALGLPVGEIAPGAPADLLAIDLEASSLAGCDAGNLLEGFVLGARDSAIAEVLVGGQTVSIDR